MLTISYELNFSYFSLNVCAQYLYMLILYYRLKENYCLYIFYSSTVATSTSTGPSGIGKNPSVDSIFNCYRPGEDRNRDHHPMIKGRNEEVVTIDDDRGERGSPPPPQHHHHESMQQQQQQQQQEFQSHAAALKVVTLGEHIANVIAKNYNGPLEHQNMSMYSHNRIHEQQQHGNKMHVGYNTGGPSSGPPSLHNMDGKQRHRSHMPHSGSGMRSMEGISSSSAGEAANSHTPSDAEMPNSWKLRRALQHEKEAAAAAAERSQQTPPPSSPAMGNHDERQIIRIAQSPSHTSSSRSSSRSSPHPLTPYAVEPISPPSQNVPDSGEPSPQQPQSWMTSPSIAGLLTNRRVYMGGAHDDRSTGSSTHQPNPSQGGQQQPIGLSPLDYVKNRIVEVMRTATGEGGGEPESSNRPSQGSPEQQRYHQPHLQQQQHPDGDIYAERPQSTGSSRSTPKEMMAHRYSPASASNSFLPRVPSSSQPSSERGTPQELGRPSYKRPMEGSEWMPEVASSHNASPSSSEAVDPEEVPKKRQRFTPPESSERNKLLYPESSSNVGASSECMVSGSRTSPQVSTNLVQSVSPSQTSASEAGFAHPSPHEGTLLGGASGVESSTGGEKGHWDVVSSGAEISSQVMDSPASGDMVIDESGMNSAPSSSSRMEPVSSLSSHDTISTSDRRHHSLEQQQILCSSSNSQASEASQNSSVSSSLGPHPPPPPPNHPQQRNSRSPKTYAYSTTPNSSVSSSGPMYTSHATPASTVSSSQQQQGQMPPFPSFSRVATTYAYPYSALSVRSMGSSGPPTPSSSSGAGAGSGGGSAPPPPSPLQVQSSTVAAGGIASSGGNDSTSSPAAVTNPRDPPLLSSQYEPLSDED